MSWYEKICLAKLWFSTEYRKKR